MRITLRPDPRPVLFVFAHQDDEIAYLGMLRHLAASGREFNVIWVTDGAHSVPAEIRRRESKKTMAALGARENRMEFWEFPDGGAVASAREIVGRLTGRMREVAPAEVFTVAYEGGHPDHDTVHFAAVIAAGRQSQAPVVYEAPLYNSHSGRFAFNVFVPAETEVSYTPLSREDLRFKLRALFNYRSQLWVTVVPLLLFGWKRALGPGEPFREVPDWNYLQPPHEGKLLYHGLVFQRILGIRFADFREAVEGVLCDGR